MGPGSSEGKAQQGEGPVIQIGDSRPVEFVRLVSIGAVELVSCTRCGATVMRSPTANGDVAEAVHRKYHEEQDH